jgi:hypothetical protein
VSADERGDAPSAGTAGTAGPGRARAVLDEIEARLEPQPGSGVPPAEPGAEGDVAGDTTGTGEPPD